VVKAEPVSDDLFSPQLKTSNAKGKGRARKSAPIEVSSDEEFAFFWILSVVLFSNHLFVELLVSPLWLTADLMLMLKRLQGPSKKSMRRL
jgi:hypothetical protein